MILITGGAGRIGRRTAEILSERGMKLRLMSRTPEKVPQLANAEIVSGDFKEPSTLAAAFAEVTTAFVISGKAPPGERARTHKNAFQAAAHAGVQHIVYLSLKGTAADSLYPYCRDHFISEQYLAECGVPYTSLRGAFYIDQFLEKFDAAGVLRGTGGDGGGAFISREDTSRAAAAILQDPPGGVLDVTGPQLVTVEELTIRLSLMTGNRLRYQKESVDEMKERLSLTDLTELQQELEVTWFQAIAAGEQAPVTDQYRQLTNKTALSIEEYFLAFPRLLDGLRSS